MAMIYLADGAPLVISSFGKRFPYMKFRIYGQFYQDKTVDHISGTEYTQLTCDD